MTPNTQQDINDSTDYPYAPPDITRVTYDHDIYMNIPPRSRLTITSDPSRAYKAEMITHDHVECRSRYQAGTHDRR